MAGTIPSRFPLARPVEVAVSLGPIEASSALMVRDAATWALAHHRPDLFGLESGHVDAEGVRCDVSSGDPRELVAVATALMPTYAKQLVFQIECAQADLLVEVYDHTRGTLLGSATGTQSARGTMTLSVTLAAAGDDIIVELSARQTTTGSTVADQCRIYHAPALVAAVSWGDLPA
jgi:hypothetical protein